MTNASTAFSGVENACCAVAMHDHTKPAMIAKAEGNRFLSTLPRRWLFTDDPPSNALDWMAD
jgi:hypothetical protein